MTPVIFVVKPSTTGNRRTSVLRVPVEYAILLSDQLLDHNQQTSTHHLLIELMCLFKHQDRSQYIQAELYVQNAAV